MRVLSCTVETGSWLFKNDKGQGEPQEKKSHSAQTVAASMCMIAKCPHIFLPLDQDSVLKGGVSI